MDEKKVDMKVVLLGARMDVMMVVKKALQLVVY
jgi:hypothetical protein